MTTDTSSEEQPGRRRVFLVDDHLVVLAGLAEIIKAQPDLMICGLAHDARQALESVTTLHPDLVVVDLALKDSSGLDLIKDLKRQDPSVRILVLSMHDERLYAERVLRASALGYIMKEESMDELLVAIRQVLCDEVYLSTRMTGRILHTLVKGHAEISDAPLMSLTDRELDVLRFLGQSYSTRKIAETLHLSVKTVEGYRARIMEKLHLEDAPALIQYAVQWVSRIGAT